MVEALILLVLIIIALALLGVVVAFSPTLIVTEVAILTRAKNPLPQTLALLAGIAAAILLIAGVAFLAIDPSQTFTFQLPSTREVVGAVPLLDILLSLLLLVVGLRLLRPVAVAVPSQPTQRKSMGSKALFWFGFIKMGTSLSSVTAILIASRIVQTHSPSAPVQLLAGVWLVAIAVLPFSLIALTKFYRPQLFARIQSTSDRVTELNWRRYVAGAVLMLSIWFMLSGIHNI